MWRRPMSAVGATASDGGLSGCGTGGVDFEKKAMKDYRSRGCKPRLRALRPNVHE